MSTGNSNARPYTRNIHSGHRVTSTKIAWKSANSNSNNKSQNIDSFIPSSYQSSNTPKTLNNGSINQHDAKGFRILTYVFAQNINNYYGKTQKSILGEI